MSYTDYQIDCAREELSRFVIAQAHKMGRALRFGYEESAKAPETFEEVLAMYDDCRHGRRMSFVVFSGASDNTVYTSREANWAFRFWHDVTHAILKADFSTDGEVVTSMTQARLVADTFGTDSIEYKLFIADTVGQVIYYAENGDFVENQLQYCKDLINNV